MSTTSESRRYRGLNLPNQALGRIEWLAPGIAAATVVGLHVLDRIDVPHIAPHAAGGVVLWLAVIESGNHATIARVVLAFVVPWPRVTWLEHLLRPWCTYLILPLFALAGIGFTVSLFVTVLTFEGTSEPRSAAVRLGILLASVVAGVVGAVLV